MSSRTPTDRIARYCVVILLAIISLITAQPTTICIWGSTGDSWDRINGEYTKQSTLHNSNAWWQQSAANTNCPTDSTMTIQYAVYKGGSTHYWQIKPTLQTDWVPWWPDCDMGNLADPTLCDADKWAVWNDAISIDEGPFTWWSVTDQPCPTLDCDRIRVTGSGNTDCNQEFIKDLSETYLWTFDSGSTITYLYFNTYTFKWYCSSNDGRMDCDDDGTIMHQKWSSLDDGWTDSSIGNSFTLDVTSGSTATFDCLDTLNPTRSPTPAPTDVPTSTPSRNPTQSPTRNPIQSPTRNPTLSPTRNPTQSPTRNPTQSPTRNPTQSPTRNPTQSPTKNPTETTLSPTKQPTTTRNPTKKPTRSPTSVPTNAPTRSPTNNPTATPSANPTISTATPTQNPTHNPTTPTQKPTQNPTTTPTQNPTTTPTGVPTSIPTRTPTDHPVVAPTDHPTDHPTDPPTHGTTDEPAQTTEPDVSTPNKPTLSPIMVTTEDEDEQDIRIVNRGSMVLLPMDIVIVSVVGAMCIFILVCPGWLCWRCRHQKQRIDTQERQLSILQVDMARRRALSTSAHVEPKGELEGDVDGDNSLATNRPPGVNAQNDAIINAMMNAQKGVSMPFGNVLRNKTAPGSNSNEHDEAQVVYNETEENVEQAEEEAMGPGGYEDEYMNIMMHKNKMMSNPDLQE